VGSDDEVADQDQPESDDGVGDPAEWTPQRVVDEIIAKWRAEHP
jgi:hypothetical protein